ASHFYSRNARARAARLRRILTARTDRRFGLRVSGLPVNPPIGQTLSGDAFQNLVGALGILDAKAGTFVVAEVVFRQIALEVLFADVVVHAGDAALHDREIVLDRIGVPELAAHVFLDRVIDGTVPVELATDALVDRRFVGH